MPAGVLDLVLHRLEDKPDAVVIAGVDVGQLGGVVPAAALPPQLVERDVVVDAEVLERRKQVLLECLPQSQLDGGASAEPGADVGAVGPLGRRREPEQDGRLEVFEQSSVGARLGVVELVDDDDVEVTGIELGEVKLVERLHGAEHVPPLAGPLAADKQLAEIALAQHVPEGRQALGQQLLAVGDEQEAVDRAVVAQASVVQRRDDGLTGAGRHHHEVAPPAVDSPLRVERLEDLLLVAVGADVKRGDLDR
jgi:hypothetical protein